MNDVTVVTCEHGKLVGLPNVTDVRECQECDWCPACGQVRRFEGEACSSCGYVWAGG